MNFALVLFILVLITGMAWVLDKCLFSPQRRQAAQTALSAYAKHSGHTDQPEDESTNTREKLYASIIRQPWWLEYSAGLFPVILSVFLLRSFVVEPFKIPSGSMMPTLVSGDFILVNKFDYGIRLPVINKKIFSNRDPRPGDVVVFRYPKDESLDYIKRVVGAPGDTVSYVDKRLMINGQKIPTESLPDFLDEEHGAYFKRYQEHLGEKKNIILNNPAAPPFIVEAGDFPFRENCRYNDHGVVCKVPQGHYFVMGDNRDDSADSRYWGFVSDKNLIGRAFFILFNFPKFKRIGRFE